MAGNRLTAAPDGLVLTLEMDGESFAQLDALRREHYPPERNRVPAHVTLFAQLPVAHGREIKALLTQVAAAEEPFDIAIAGVKAMERGVAVALYAPQLHQLREELLDEWWHWLDERELTLFQPHVTIQNNVSEAEAGRTQKSVAAALRLRRIRGVGLHLWRFVDGHWKSERLFRFR